jgi:4-amino-4-deoxy-L-arabinose transferase-like glycosyltransferase
MAQSIFAFAIIYIAEVLLHWPLLKLPYFWDEAGYYVPAAYDIYTSFALVPHSTLSNAHPPLVMLWLALCWKLFGYSPSVARLAMLAIAAFGLTGLYRLARRVTTNSVALASMICVALYPVWFAQSSLAHVDLAAASLVLWALSYYVEERRWMAAVFFSLAVLAKETALIAPVALLGWELLGAALVRFCPTMKELLPEPRTVKEHALLLLPALPLSLWFAYHYAKTGYVFGNPEFFRYNVRGTLHPLRIALALVQRLWQAFGHMNLFALTLAMVAAMFLPALKDGDAERPRIVPRTQIIFALLVLTHAVAFAIIGGALLARYMLPAVPLVVIIAVSTLRRRVPYWPVAIALICALFVAGWTVSPPYRFAPEDNLAYADFVRLHQAAAQEIERHHPNAQVLTAWPATDELSRPFLGYVTKPVKVAAIQNFTLEQIQLAARQPESFDAALFFATKYEPPRRIPPPAFWKHAQKEYFDDHADLPAATAARILGGDIVWKNERLPLWAAIATFQRARNASLSLPPMNVDQR